MYLKINKMKFSKRLSQVGEYYFSKKLEEVRNLENKGKKIINFGIGSPNLMPSEATIETLITSAQNQNNHSYQPYKGLKQLRQGIAEWYLKNYDVYANSETEILPLMGSKEGIFYLTMSLIDDGDEVLIPNPGYPAYANATKLLGGVVKYYNLFEKNDWYPDFDELENYNLERVKLMWINYPHMPTGAIANESIFRKIVDFGIKHNIIICNDNPYSMVLNTTPPLSIFNFDKKKEVSVELNSLSKSFNMAGWRIGMLLANKSIVDAVLQIKSNVDSGMFKPIQDAAIKALLNPPEWHKFRNNIYSERKFYVTQMLDRMNCKYSNEQVGMFI
jgi:hypothetical protein